MVGVLVLCIHCDQCFVTDATSAELIEILRSWDRLLSRSVARDHAVSCEEDAIMEQ